MNDLIGVDDDPDGPEDGLIPPPNPDDGTRPGRPTKLTQAVQDAAVRLLTAGMPPQSVASSLQLGWSTWKGWRALGRKHPDGVYGAFDRAVQAAVGEYHARTLMAIQADVQAGNGWLGLAMLERRFLTEWNKTYLLRRRQELDEAEREAEEKRRRLEEREKVLEDIMRGKLPGEREREARRKALPPGDDD